LLSLDAVISQPHSLLLLYHPIRLFFSRKYFTPTSFSLAVSASEGKAQSCFLCLAEHPAIQKNAPAGRPGMEKVPVIPQDRKKLPGCGSLFSVQKVLCTQPFEA
jgi:hypothetical protein